jgi:hypothetical protein
MSLLGRTPAVITLVGKSNRSNRANLPYRFITFCILDAGGISLCDHVAKYIFHQQVGREDSLDEVSSNVEIVEIVLEQRRDLRGGWMIFVIHDKRVDLLLRSTRR